MIKAMFPSNGISAIALRYTQMKRGKPVNPNMLITLSPKRFKKPSHARRCLEGLERLELVSKVDTDAWSITDKGKEYLRLSAERYVGEHATKRK